jgi:hypothetical protein
LIESPEFFLDKDPNDLIQVEAEDVHSEDSEEIPPTQSPRTLEQQPEKKSKFMNIKAFSRQKSRDTFSTQTVLTSLGKKSATKLRKISNVSY